MSSEEAQKKQDYLVWIDCEMTGLDLEQDCLVEVAVVLTDFDGNIIDPGIDLLIQPRPESLAGMDSFVRKMHTRSGLLKALETEAIPLAQAKDKVLEYLHSHDFFEKDHLKNARLAGNSVGTDKSFLAKEMPELIEQLHYRIVDVSMIKELAERWYPKAYYQAPAKNGGHRALADILESIQELAYYREAIFRSQEGELSSSDYQAIAQHVSQRYQPYITSAIAQA